MKSPVLRSNGSAEPYLTIPEAAKELGIPVSTLRRAVNSGLVPSHRPFSQRVRVRLFEVVTAIETNGRA